MKKCYKLAGCFTCLYVLTAIVFFIILMINKFNAGVDWLTGFFLIFGLVGLVMIAPMFVNLFFYHGAKNDGKYGCSCKYNDEESNTKKY